MIRKVCFFGPKKKRFMQTESVLQTKNRSGPAKNRFSVALLYKLWWKCQKVEKGLGSGRVKIGPVKFAKFQSGKIINVLSFLICLNFDLEKSFKFWVGRPQNELGKAFLYFLAVFGMFERIIYIEPTDVTSPFFFIYSSLLKETNRCAKYLFVTSVRSYLKLNFSIFCYPKNVVKWICQILMFRALTSSAGNIFEDIYTHVIN